MSWVFKIQEAINYIEEHLNDNVNAEVVGKAINYAPSSFQQLFSAITGYSIGGYIRLRRLSQAASELVKSDISVTELAFRCGYNTVESFSKAFKRLHGCSPSAALKNRKALKAFDPISINFEIEGGFNMMSNIIPNVILGLKPVDWTDVSRQSEYIWSVVSALQKLGDNISYDYLVVASGSAFRASMADDSLNHGSYHVQNNLEVIPHTFRILGYDISLFDRSDFKTDSKLIMTSIDKGIPVITIEGVINCSDCCIIGGYDDGGRVLLGYNPFMNVKEDHDEPHDDTGYFRKTNWHSGYFAENNGRYIIIKEKTNRIPEKQICLETIKIACKLIRGTKTSGQLDGYAAHTEYAKRLCEEPEDIFDLYLHILCNLKLYIDKTYVAGFLRNAITELPEFETQLESAATCYDKVSVLRNKLSTIIEEGFSENGMNAVADKQKREAYADIILQIRDLEALAADCLEECIV